ncbi:hypothetical protein ACM66B_002234 [Microbotryomycetes sp. NB124-2]
MSGRFSKDQALASEAQTAIATRLSEQVGGIAGVDMSKLERLKKDLALQAKSHARVNRNWQRLDSKKREHVKFSVQSLKASFAAYSTFCATAGIDVYPITQDKSALCLDFILQEQNPTRVHELTGCRPTSLIERAHFVLSGLSATRRAANVTSKLWPPGQSATEEPRAYPALLRIEQKASHLFDAERRKAEAGGSDALESFKLWDNSLSEMTASSDGGSAGVTPILSEATLPTKTISVGSTLKELTNHRVLRSRCSLVDETIVQATKKREAELAEQENNVERPPSSSLEPGEISEIAKHEHKIANPSKDDMCLATEHFKDVQNKRPFNAPLSTGVATQASLQTTTSSIIDQNVSKMSRHRVESACFIEDSALLEPGEIVEIASNEKERAQPYQAGEGAATGDANATIAQQYRSLPSLSNADAQVSGTTSLCNVERKVAFQKPLQVQEASRESIRETRSEAISSLRSREEGGQNFASPQKVSALINVNGRSPASSARQAKGPLRVIIPLPTSDKTDTRSSKALGELARAVGSHQRRQVSTSEKSLPAPSEGLVRADPPSSVVSTDPRHERARPELAKIVTEPSSALKLPASSFGPSSLATSARMEVGSSTGLDDTPLQNVQVVPQKRSQSAPSTHEPAGKIPKSSETKPPETVSENKSDQPKLKVTLKTPPSAPSSLQLRVVLAPTSRLFSKGKTLALPSGLRAYFDRSETVSYTQLKRDLPDLIKYLQRVHDPTATAGQRRVISEVVNTVPGTARERVADATKLYCNLCDALGIDLLSITTVRKAIFALAYSPARAHRELFITSSGLGRHNVRPVQVQGLLSKNMLDKCDELMAIEKVIHDISLQDRRQWQLWREGFASDIDRDISRYDCQGPDSQPSTPLVLTPFATLSPMSNASSPEHHHSFHFSQGAIRHAKEMASKVWPRPIATMSSTPDPRLRLTSARQNESQRAQQHSQQPSLQLPSLTRLTTQSSAPISRLLPPIQLQSRPRESYNLTPFYQQLLAQRHSFVAPPQQLLSLEQASQFGIAPGTYSWYLHMAMNNPQAIPLLSDYLERTTQLHRQAVDPTVHAASQAAGFPQAHRLSVAETQPQPFGPTGKDRQSPFPSQSSVPNRPLPPAPSAVRSQVATRHIGSLKSRTPPLPPVMPYKKPQECSSTNDKDRRRTASPQRTVRRKRLRSDSHFEIVIEVPRKKLRVSDSANIVSERESDGGTKQVGKRVRSSVRASRAPAAGSAKAAASACPAGTKLTGLNYLKDGADPVAKDDDEYPNWLWTLVEPAKKPTNSSSKRAATIDLEAAQRKLKRDSKAAIKASNTLKG